MKHLKLLLAFEDKRERINFMKGEIGYEKLVKKYR